MGATVPTCTYFSPQMRGKACSDSQGLLGRHVRQLKRVGHGAINDVAVMYVEDVAQMRVVGQRLLPALIREREDEGRGRVAESKRRGTRNGARHVGHAIV